MCWGGCLISVPTACFGLFAIGWLGVSCCVCFVCILICAWFVGWFYLFAAVGLLCSSLCFSLSLLTIRVLCFLLF